MLPMDYWQLADRLIAKEKCPAGYRSSISRAYYAAFLTASRFIDETGSHIPSGPNKHERVPAILAKAEDAKIVEAGAKLTDLRGERNTADYELSEKDVEEEDYARLRLATAFQIMDAIDTCRNAKGERYKKVSQAMSKFARELREGRAAPAGGNSR